MESKEKYFSKNPKALQRIVNQILAIANISLARLYIDTFFEVVSEVSKKASLEMVYQGKNEDTRYACVLLPNAIIEDSFFESKDADMHPSKHSFLVTFLPFDETIEIYVWFMSGGSAYCHSYNYEAIELLREVGYEDSRAESVGEEMLIDTWQNALELLNKFAELEKTRDSLFAY